MRVLVLGVTGMLGHEVARVLRREGHEVIGTRRLSSTGTDGGEEIFDCVSDEIRGLLRRLGGFDLIVNAIGLIKPHINEKDVKSVKEAISVNSVFPLSLAIVAESLGIPVIQIATDCVFSGERGSYLESDNHDAIDIYGKTKSLGEALGSRFLHIRCSIIGREVERRTSLLEWIVQQPDQAHIKGFTNHLWNGVSTTAFARVTAGLIHSGRALSGVMHLVPRDEVSKYELLKLVARYAGRPDLVVDAFETEKAVNRTLATVSWEANESLWRGAGYEMVPTVSELVEELFSTRGR